MKQFISSNETMLAVVVLHLGVTVAHAVAHVQARVTLSSAALLFIVTIVFIGPLVGLIMQRTTYPLGGTWMIAVTLAGALCFGVANHFVILGVDHVTHVPEDWRVLFETTAVLLAVTESFGSGIAVWSAMREGSRT
jgi:hypothetical protein